MHIKRKPGHPAAGCILLPEDDLLNFVHWLDPNQRSLIIMGADEELGMLTVE